MIYYKCGVTVLYDKFIALAESAMIFSIILSVFLYVWALGAPRHALAPGGNSGELNSENSSGLYFVPSEVDVSIDFNMVIMLPCLHNLLCL